MEEDDGEDKRPGGRRQGRGWMMTFTTSLALARYPRLGNGSVSNVSTGRSRASPRTHRQRNETLFCFRVVDRVETKALSLALVLFPSFSRTLARSLADLSPPGEPVSGVDRKRDF